MNRRAFFAAAATAPAAIRDPIHPLAAPLRRAAEECVYALESGHVGVYDPGNDVSFLVNGEQIAMESDGAAGVLQV